MSEEPKLDKRIAELEMIIQNQQTQIASYQSLIQSTNQRLQSVLYEIQSDIQKMTEIQRLLVPKEIKKIQGVEFSSRFVPGQKIGGDYYDIFPIEDSQRFGIIMSCAGSYGLSALVLSMLVAVAPRLEAKANLDVTESVTRLIDSVTQQLKPQDAWSLFYGVFDKKYLELEYVLLGNIRGAIKPSPGGEWETLEPLGGEVKLQAQPQVFTTKVQLEPLGQLVLSSPGLNAGLSLAEWLGALAQCDSQDVHDLRNHLFLSHSAQPAQDDFPDRDQTGIVMQVKDRLIRLAK